MLQDDVKPLRPWRESAELLSEESDSCKALTLAEELIRALDRESTEPLRDIEAKQNAP